MASAARGRWPSPCRKRRTGSPCSTRGVKQLEQQIDALPRSKGRHGECKEILDRYITGMNGLGQGSKLYFSLNRGDMPTASKMLSTLERNIEQLKQDVQPGSGWISGS